MEIIRNLYQKGGLHMSQELFKKYISEMKDMLSKLTEKDIKIVKSLYTILLQYLEHRGRS